VKMLFKF